MNISPKDIKKSDFKKSLRGFDPHEVEAFLETVSSHYERLLVENSQLQEKIRTLTSDIEIYKENESTLQKAITKSQELTDEIISNARKKAENIVKEAELNAQKIGQDFDKEILVKKHELEEIKLRNDKLIEDVKSYLADKLSELEDFIKSKKVFRMKLTSEKDESEDENPEQENKITDLSDYNPAYEKNSDVNQ